MSPALSTFLFELANFAVLAAVLGKLFFRPVRKAIDDRRAAVAGQLEQAAGKLAEAERKRAEIERRQHDLDREFEELRRQARQAAQREAETLLAEARAKSQRERETLAGELANLRQSHLAALSQSAAAAAGCVVARLLAQIEGPALEGALAKAVCRQLAALDPNRLAPVLVESERPLAADARRDLLEALGPAAATAEFRNVAGLGPGLRVITAQGLIDASTSGLAGHAQRALSGQREEPGQ